MADGQSMPGARPVRKAISAGLRFSILTRDRFTCRYCGARAPDVSLEVDHVHPVSKGGTNQADNLVTACWTCNAGKADRVLELLAFENPNVAYGDGHSDGHAVGHQDALDWVESDRFIDGFRHPMHIHCSCGQDQHYPEQVAVRYGRQPRCSTGIISYTCRDCAPEEGSYEFFYVLHTGEVVDAGYGEREAEGDGAASFLRHLQRRQRAR